MAIQLECNYSKKLGLPGYSSHQFSITVRTEISDVNQVQQESARLYKLLQTGVDASIQEPGFLPNQGNGNGNGGNGHNNRSNGSNGGGKGSNGRSDGEWNCSPKQRALIERTVNEHGMDKNEVEKLAQDRFGKGVVELNKLEASGLIEELFQRTGQSQGNGRGRFQRAGGR